MAAGTALSRPVHAARNVSVSRTLGWLARWATTLLAVLLPVLLQVLLAIAGQNAFAQDPGAVGGTPAPAALHGRPQTRVVQGQNFTYTLPAGWRMAEEGNHALVLVAEDKTAIIIVYGTGAPEGATPQSYAHRFFTTTLIQSTRSPAGQRLSDPRLANPTQVRPMPGYKAALLADVTMNSSGPDGQHAVVGQALTNIAAGPGGSEGVIVAVLARKPDWAQLRTWLPEVAMAAFNTGPRPFGRVSAPPPRDYGEHIKWSRQYWAEVQR